METLTVGQHVDIIEDQAHRHHGSGTVLGAWDSTAGSYLDVECGCGQVVHVVMQGEDGELRYRLST